MKNYREVCTSCFEGIYTEDEVALNNRLYEECSKETLDCEAIEMLLRQGADPLGPTVVSGWGLLDHIYGEILCESQDLNSINLPIITELFLKHGMDIDKPRIPYDDGNSLHPMWQFALVINENSMCVLEMLLDNRLSADSAGEVWKTMISDLLDVECGDPVNSEFWKCKCTLAMKVAMFCASYDHILNNDEELYKFIGCSYNNYDIHKFREWDDFYCMFDTSRCERWPELYRSVVNIYHKESNERVWRIGVCLDDPSPTSRRRSR